MKRWNSCGWRLPIQALTKTPVERVRGQVLSAIRSGLKDPDGIAARRFDELAFGAHPYGSSIYGTLDSVSALTRDDIVAAHRSVLVRDRLHVGAVGDITAEELGLLLDDLLGGLPTGGAGRPDPVMPDFAGGVEVVPYDIPSPWRFSGMGEFPAMTLISSPRLCSHNSWRQ